VAAAASGKENARPTYKGGVGFVPNLATCDNVDDVLVIDPRPGNATSNDAADNIAALDAAAAAIPGTYRRRVLVRLDGAGFSHKLLEHIAAGGGVKGRRWESSVGWSCTDREIDAIDRAPKALWQNGIDQDGTLLTDTRVADITGLLDLTEWHEQIPHLRVIARDEPLHPKYTKRASEREKARGRRYQLIAVNADTGQGRLARRPAPLPRPRRGRHQAGQGPRAEPVAVAPLEDQRGLARKGDRRRRPGRDPAGRVPASRPAPRQPPRRLDQDPAVPPVHRPRPHHPRTTQDLPAPTHRLALDPTPRQRPADDQGPARTDLTPPHRPDNPKEGTTRPVEPGAPRRDSRTPTLPTGRKP
jgi:hypothetical protein